MKAPNFFIIGAPKCGTTALTVYLSDRPDVFMCTPKEPNYFADDLPGLQFAKKLDEYLALFHEADEKHSAVGEASTCYLNSKCAVDNIRSFNDQARLFVMLRNPIEVVRSLHSKLLTSLDEDEPDFQKAWNLQEDRSKGRNAPEKCLQVERLLYESMGKLGDQVERLLDRYPRDLIRFIVFDDFVRDTRAEYERALFFLGLESDGREMFPVVNPNEVLRLRRIGGFVQRPPEGLVKWTMAVKKRLGVAKLGIFPLLRRLSLKQVKREPLDPEMRRILVDAFSDDVEKLGRLLDRDFSHWMKGP